MTDGQKYSDMPIAVALTGAELVCVSQNGVSRQTTPNAFVTLASGLIIPVAVAAAVAQAVSDSGDEVVTDPALVFGAAQQGVVPASGGGTANFLRADGTWAAAGGSQSVATLFKGNQTLASVGDAFNIPTVAVAAAIGDQFIIEGSARYTGVSGGQSLAVSLRDSADTTLLTTLFDILGANGTNQIYFRHLITITAIAPALVGTVGGMAAATGGTPSLDTRANAGSFTGLTAAAFQYRVELAGNVGNCQLNNLVMYRVTGP